MCLKYVFDRVISLLGIIILFPLLLLIAIFVFVDNPSIPIIFKQVRIGQNGKRFIMYKFRTMNQSNEVSKESYITVYGDKRISKIGKVLRQTKLDELPELVNILKSEMSFVGPRPDMPGYADKLTGESKKILKFKPGLTGPASLKYANEEKILSLQKNPVEYNDCVIYPDKVRINLNYIENWSFILDLKIIIFTIFSIKYEDKF